MSQQPRKLLHLPKVRMLAQRGGRQTSGIRITSVKTIKPPDPDLVKQQEEDRLRAELHKEIVNRSRTCVNDTYECLVPVVSGSKYCGRHILQDPTAPYKKCEHFNCNMPAPKHNTEGRDLGLCYSHARAALQTRQHSSAPPPPVLTTETLLNQLQHYVRPERVRTASCASSVSVVSDPAELDLPDPSALDPFKQIDATVVNNNYSSSLMECMSASDSDSDGVTVGVGGTCRQPHSDDDADTAEPDLRVRWHAGVFTAEEAISEAKDVLTSLQSAYIRQMGRLRTLLQTARLQYLTAVKQEKEQYCSINSQARGGHLTVRERRQLKKLKSYASYHRKHGVDAVLARKLYRKRAKAAESYRPAPARARCKFSEGGVRCAEIPLPAAKHCSTHILCDKQQVLYLACGDVRSGDSACQAPLPRLPALTSCLYHTDPPLYTLFSTKKDDTGSSSESETTDASATDDAEPPELMLEADFT